MQIAEEDDVASGEICISYTIQKTQKKNSDPESRLVINHKTFSLITKI